MSGPYDSLIPAENAQQPAFMALVGTLTSAMAAITSAAQAVPKAFVLDTAVYPQLDVIGQWVGQSRTIAEVLILGFFGFADNEAAATFGELNNLSIGGAFWELGTPFEGTNTLSDPDYRTIIRARIVRNQSQGNLQAIEDALAFIFGSQASVTDNGNKTLQIAVLTPVTQTDFALLTSLDILPRPAGVEITSITNAS